MSVRGFRLCPTSAIFSGVLCFANSALTYYYGGRSAVLGLFLAGCLMIGYVPFTLVFIVQTEEKLLRKESKLRQSRNLDWETGKEQGSSSFKKLSEETRAMLVRWSIFNYGRAVFPVLGMLLAWTLW
ncbi:hypothetical protein NHQ30_002299 [Ciborinia camelliae]|nr:hypothetical protein NHQ30_002299 [Ciborinia camelliae]